MKGYAPENLKRPMTCGKIFRPISAPANPIKKFERYSTAPCRRDSLRNSFGCFRSRAALRQSRGVNSLTGPFSHVRRGQGCEYLVNTGICFIRTCINHNVVVAERMDYVHKPAHATDHAVTARALASFKDFDRAGDANREHIQAIERPPAALIHLAVVQHVI